MLKVELEIAQELPPFKVLYKTNGLENESESVELVLAFHILTFSLLICSLSWLSGLPLTSDGKYCWKLNPQGREFDSSNAGSKSIYFCHAIWLLLFSDFL